MDVIACEMPDGTVSVVHPAPGMATNDVVKDIPVDAIHSEVVDDSTLPGDRIFRNAWTKASVGQPVVEDLPKAREIAHNRRRARRDADFAPHDEVFAKQVPGSDFDGAEAARVAIRAEDDARQIAIDAAANPTALKALMASGNF